MLKPQNNFLNRDTARCNGLKQIVDADITEIRKRYLKPVVVPYKVELADLNLKYLLQELQQILE